MITGVSSLRLRRIEEKDERPRDTHPFLVTSAQPQLAAEISQRGSEVSIKLVGPYQIRHQSGGTAVWPPRPLEPSNNNSQQFQETPSVGSLAIHEE